MRVLGIARGGVAVAAPIARELGRPLDVLVVRKLGLPWAPEVAFGAIGPYGVDIRAIEAETHLTRAEADAIASNARVEVDRQVTAYRHGRPPLDLTGETAVLVDDGLATGATAQAAVALARELRAARVVVAVPVGAERAVADLRLVADDVVCPIVPAFFDAVSRYYDTFGQVHDDEVVALLAAADRSS
jgi:predicted phosphoribosyltransferase